MPPSDTFLILPSSYNNTLPKVVEVIKLLLGSPLLPLSPSSWQSERLSVYLDEIEDMRRLDVVIEKVIG